MKAAYTKQHNANLRQKVEQRLRGLAVFSAPAIVLDCCMGPGLIWQEIRKQQPVEEYMGLDLKPQRGGLRMDSRRYCKSPAVARHSVIDIDTYGAPWEHYFAAADRIRSRWLVFLTIGQVMMGTQWLAVDDIIGRRFADMPQMLRAKIAQSNAPHLLAYPNKCGMVLEWHEITRHKNAVYAAMIWKPQE